MSGIASIEREIKKWHKPLKGEEIAVEEGEYLL